MVQPQYSPKEALNKIKLMMNYDSSKTLNENKETIKSLISEGGKDAAVRAILQKCDSGTVDLGKARMDVQDHIDMAALFDKAFSSAFGTSNDDWRNALKKMSAEGVFEDLCAIASQYKELAEEEFADGIDADIDFDSEYTEFTTAFQKMIKRGTQQSLKVKNAQSSDISYFEKNFPCIFQSNSNVNQQTEMDQNKYIFIRVKAISGKQFAVFSDGRVKTIPTVGGQPDKQTGKKLTCNGSKVGFIAETVVKKKSLSEQFDDSELTSIETPDPDKTPAPSPNPKPKVNVKSASLEKGATTSPGDPYQYKFVEGQWWSKGLLPAGVAKLPNWVSLKNNSKATDILNKRYPTLITSKAEVKVDTNIEDVDGEDPNKI